MLQSHHLNHEKLLYPVPANYHLSAHGNIVFSLCCKHPETPGQLAEVIMASSVDTVSKCFRNYTCLHIMRRQSVVSVEVSRFCGLSCNRQVLFLNGKKMFANTVRVKVKVPASMNLEEVSSLEVSYFVWDLMVYFLASPNRESICKAYIHNRYMV